MISPRRKSAWSSQIITLIASLTCDAVGVDHSPSLAQPGPSAAWLVTGG